MEAQRQHFDEFCAKTFVEPGASKRSKTVTKEKGKRIENFLKGG